MTKLSRFPVDGKKINMFTDDFWTSIAALRNKTEAKAYFSQLLSHTEQKMLAKRLQIAMMLCLGYEYGAIRNRVKVSDGTIAMISNKLNNESSVVKEMALRIIRLKHSKANLYSESRSSRYARDVIDLTVGSLASISSKVLKTKSLVS